MRRLTLTLWTLTTAMTLLCAAEFTTRIALRISKGAWPETRAVTRYRVNQTVLGLYRRHPFLNTAPREGAKIQVYGKTASFNSLGYRSPERPIIKPSGTLRVVCSVGSTTFDLLADNDSTSWPWVMEENLAARGLEVEVWNAGFPGWTSVENDISFLLRDQDLKPDVAVLFQGINDLQPASHRPFDRYYEKGHADKQVEALGFQGSAPRLLERSLLIELLSGTTRSRVSETPLAAEIDGAALSVFRRNVLSYVSLAHSVGARVVLATQPLRVRRDQQQSDLNYVEGWLRLEGEAVESQLTLMNEVLRSIATRDDVDLADVAADISFNDQDFLDPMHYSGAGSRKIAAYLARTIAPLLTGGADRIPVHRRAAKVESLGLSERHRDRSP